ncbi:MAG TPA: septal ring lytic transglycosylase RlpA family protein [Ohtaekwangia sp.]|nr:septal ring lytic transglycosylase RlpA family protein [Ohtaekwangia sp.]
MKNFLLPLLCLLLAAPVFGQVQTGKASFYADKFEGSKTASGEKYRKNKMTAAHKTLPFGTKVKVTNLGNNESVVVVINDRGPFVEGRVIDLSRAAAEKLRFVNQGIADVSIEVVDPGDGKTKPSEIRIDNVAVEDKEFYDFRVERKRPNGFGVQIGNYQELVNLMRIAENLKQSYKKEVTVQVKVLNGVKYYGLILGNFSSRAKAEQFRADIKQKYPDAFIVEFSRM